MDIRSEDPHQCLLRLRRGRNDILKLHDRFRQGLQVDLAVRRQRHHIQPDIGGGNHIAGKGLPHERLEVVRVNRSLLRIVQAQLVTLNLGAHITDLRVRGSCLFHLSHLDPESAKLHLEVNPSFIDQFISLIVMPKVPGMVDAHALSEEIAVQRSKTPAGHLRKIVVAKGDLRSRKADLSPRMAGKQIAVPVQDQGPGIRHRPADGELRVIVLIHHMIGGADREFRGAISVDDLYIRLLYRQKLLSAHHHIMERQAVIAIEHRHTHLGRQCETHNLMILEILVHAPHIPAKVVRQNMDRRSCAEGADGVVKGSVKSKARVLPVSLTRSDPKIMDPPRRKCAQRAMGLHNPLGLPGRSGSIDHIRAAIRPCSVHRSRIRKCIKCPGDGLFREHHIRAGIGDDIVNPVLRIFRIHRHKRCACFVYAKDRRQVLLPAADLDDDKAAL